MAFWAIAAPMIASALGGLAQGAFGGKGGGQTGYDMPTMTPSPYDANNQRLSSEYAQNALLRSQAGQLPEGMETLLDRIKKTQMLMAYQQMYGMGGKQGIMGDTMAMGSIGGVGPKAMMAQGRTALNDYAQRNAQIQNYIDSLKFAGLQDTAKNVVSDIQRIPRSMEIPWSGQLPQYNMPNAPGVDLGLDKINWADVFKPSQQNQTSSILKQYNMQPSVLNPSGNDYNTNLVQSIMGKPSNPLGQY